MKKYLLPNQGKFYKANLHSHSTVSDGKYSPEELKKMYMEKGYSIIAYTDHEVFISHDDLTDENFLALNGFETGANEPNSDEKPGFDDVRICHLCFIALDKNNKIHPVWHRNVSCWGNMAQYKDQVQFDENEPNFPRTYSPENINEMMKRGREHGFFVTYNHPAWSLESYPDYMRYEGMNAMEIFNTASYNGGHEDYNPEVYDDLLRLGKRIYCVAADDNHGSPQDFFGGFVMIKAEQLEYNTITSALEKGNFYASRGPQIYDLWFEDGKVHITCSDARTIEIGTGGRRTQSVWGENGNPVTEAEFKVMPGDRYIRLTVTDAEGNTANTNAYFTDELFDSLHAEEPAAQG